MVIARILCRQADVALGMHDEEQAEKLCMESFAMNGRLENHGDSSLITADVLLVKAHVALAIEEYQEVEEFGRESLEAREQIYGTDTKHPKIAEAIRVLAEGQFKRGEVGAAVELVKRC